MCFGGENAHFHFFKQKERTKSKGEHRKGMVNEYRVPMLGLGEVGKSSLAALFVHEQPCNVGDDFFLSREMYVKQIVVDGVVCHLHLMDSINTTVAITATQEEFKFNADGIICVFDVTSKVSFDKIDSFRQDILNIQKVTSIPMVLCGNKSDLKDDREVEREEGEAKAEEFGCRYVETCLGNGINEECFFGVVREILAAEEVKRKKKKTLKGRIKKLRSGENW